MKNSNEEKGQQLPQQIQEYASLLKSNIWMIGSISVAISLVAIIGIALMKDAYKASTTILVDPQQIPDRYVASTVPADPSERLNTISQQVLSETRLGEIIDSMDLYPELRGHAREDIVENMRRHITLQVKQSSGQGLGSFTITYEGSAAATVAKVANQLASSFIFWNLKSREQRAEDTTKFMATQLEEAKQNLQNQEQKLRDFKMRHVGSMPDQMPANLQTLARLQASLQANSESLNRMEQEKQLLTRLPDTTPPSPNAQLSDRARLEIEHRQLSNQLWDLKKKYTDAHPDVVAAAVRLKEVQRQIDALPPATPETLAKEPSSSQVRIDMIEREKQRLTQDQHRIQQQSDAYQSKVDAVPLLEQELSDLTRDYEISKEHYRSLLEKTLSAEMATDLERRQQGEKFTILDPARAPDRPFKPTRLAFMVGAVFGSLLFAVAVVVVKDLLSGTVKSDRELKDMLPQSVMFLGSIPSIELNEDRRRARRMHVYAVVASLVGCLITAAILWKVHPIL